MTYQVCTRIDQSGATIWSQEGLVKGEFDSLQDARQASSTIPGGYILRKVVTGNCSFYELVYPDE